ncbi:hypothetical protein ACWD4O_14220 [Streptomyces sp. NPDC002623]
MIEITSYLGSSSGRLTNVRVASRFDGDSDYVEGAIDLVINGVTVIDTSMEDYVDQLWAYFIAMMLKLQTAVEAKTYFPDQPIELKFSKIGGGQVLVSCDAGDGLRAAAVELDYFLQEMSLSAARFFRTLSKLIPENAASYEHQLARIEELRAE